MKHLQFGNESVKRISVSEAKKILNRNENNYTDEEVKKILDYLFVLAEIEMEFLKKKLGLGDLTFPKERFFFNWILVFDAKLLRGSIKY